MTLAITHSTVVVVPDDGTSPVGTDEWNAAHTLTGTVSVAQGGTGTSTALTQGSVVFAGASGVYSQNNLGITWDDTNKKFGLGDGSILDVFLQRDAANLLAQRNSTNAQSFKVYNTFTNSSNYERGIFDWQGTANLLTIGTEAAGTGTVRGMQFWAGSTSWLDYNAANAGKSTLLATMIVGNHHGTTLATATQLVFADYINSGSTGPVVLWNVPFQGYVGMGQATTSSSDCRWWIGQATGPNGGWDTSTSSGHTLNLEVFNGSLGLGSAGTVDVYATRSAAGVLTLSQTVGGAANVQLAAASVRGAAVAFASLPTAVEGMLVAVTDSTTVVWGATITGGGGNHVLAYYNGTNWTVAGK